MKTAIYVRVSTEEQVREGYSLAAQEERLRAYALSQDWEVIKLYKDEGRSAKDLERPELQKMMEDIKSGLIDVVLVYRLDRLTRSVLDLYKLLETFDKYDVKFKSATEVYDTTTATGRLFITLVAALAQWERENLAERVKMGMLKKATLGEWSGGTSPYGYEYKENKFAVVPKEKNLVKKMFTMARTMGMDRIARELNKQGYRTRKNAEFAGFTVQYIVTNPFYIGKMRFNNERYQFRKSLDEQQLFDSEIIEPIIDETEFWDLQRILEGRKENKGRGKTGGYYFTSILKCAKCGGPMTGTVYGSTKYYRCQRKTKGHSCVMPNIKEDSIADDILKNLKKYISGGLEFSSLGDKSNDEAKKEIEHEIKTIQKQTEKYKLMFINEIIDIEELNMKVSQLRTREKELKKEIASSDGKEKQWTSEEIEEIANNFPSLWKISTDEERKVLIATIFDEIIIDADEKAKVSPGKPKPFWMVNIK